MFNKIRTRLILIIVSAIIFSIVSVSLIIRFSLSDEFDKYRIEEQNKEFEDILNIVVENYKRNYKWNYKNLKELEKYSILNNYDITIKDKDNNIIYLDLMDNHMFNMHMSMMSKINGFMKDKISNMMNMRFSDYKIKDYEIIVDNKKVGTLEIGYLGPFMINERDLKFFKSIQNSILFSAIISIIAAIIISIYFSNKFSKPIIAITKATNDISEGKLDVKISEKTKIEELKELTNSINNLSYTLKKQYDLRKRLTSDITHELRTPLTILKSHLEAISDGVFEPTKDRLDKFSNEVKRLINLVEELKYLNDIENHNLELNLSDVNLSELVKEVIESFNYEYKNKNIILTDNIEENIFIKGDIDKLKQIFINLLSNAYKFTNKNGHVNITLSIDKKYIVFEIEDNGIGISKDDIKFIFERLYRTEKSRNRKSGGSGIGLTITRKLVEAHSGSIHVESELGKGSKFTIKFKIKNKNS